MPDSKLDDAATKALLSAGKRAMSDLLLTDEEREKRDAKEAAQAKRKRTQRIVIGVLGLFVVIGIVGLVLNYWQWFLAAGVLGFAGWYGIRRLKQGRAPKAVSKPTAKPARVEATPAVVDRKERVRAIEEDRAQLERETEEELAALKARLGK